MQNKKVIRISDKKEGTFTTVSYSILKNNNLKPIDKLLMIEILSDSDSFQFNQETYAKRLNVERKAIGRSIKNLVKEGYLKKPTSESKGKGNGFKWYYIISEYGNLNNESKQVQEKDIEVTPQPVKELIQSEEEMVIEDYCSVIQGELDSWINNGEKIDIKGCCNYIFDAFDVGKITKPEQLSIDNINKIINKFRIKEPVVERLTIKQCESIIRNKITNDTKAQVETIVRKVKEWFADNGCAATEEEIRSKTFRTQHHVLTADRIIDQRYND